MNPPSPALTELFVATLLFATVASCGSGSADSGTPYANSGGASANGGSTAGQGGVGEAGAGGVSPYKYPDAPSFCDAVSVAECSAAATNACGPTIKGCISQVHVICSESGLDFQSFDTQYDYNAAIGEACVDALTVAYATQPIPASAYLAARTACLQAYATGSTLDSPCTSDSSCVSSLGLRCWFASPTVGGCRVLQPVAAGGDCSSPGSECPAGFECDSGVCAAISAVMGSSCSSVSLCPSGLICYGRTVSGVGNCQPPQPEGGPCSSDEECTKGTVCFADSYSQNHCVSEIVFGQGLESCGRL